jgi:NAD+ kinase
MIGVNFGNLGFLTEIAPDELMKVLEDFEAHRGIISERRMLQATVFRQKEEVFKGQAVNEVAILKAVEAPLLELDLLLDDEDMLRLRADGLLVATTTGSTAYSLSAGGSIVHPDVPAMLITPIMPHLLAIRPLVMPLDSKFKTSVLEYKGRVSLSLDGQVHFELKPNDDILITQAKTTVRFLRSPSKTYFEILRQKLSWGSTGVKRK